MNKLNVIHIHTDYKFVSNSQFFVGERFNNKIFIIQRDKPYPLGDQNDVNLYDDNPTDLKRIVNECWQADLVVLYDLDITKSRIAVQLPSTVKIAWRFFGYELYDRNKEKFLSERTQVFYLHKFNPSFITKSKRHLYKVYEYIKYKQTSSQLFDKALKRIDYMLALSEEEYRFLKEEWPNLPDLVILASNNRKLNKEPSKGLSATQRPVILLGNSKGSYNNHLDLIDIIEKTPNKQNYNFTILFNYGWEGNYAKAVRGAVSAKMHYTLIEDFIPYEEFNEFYKRPTALVINAYRQLAGANINMAFANGIKVYLNTKNVYRNFLLNEGFKVFTIEDFENDLKNNALGFGFDQETAMHNFSNFEKFTARRPKEDFQKELYSKINTTSPT